MRIDEDIWKLMSRCVFNEASDDEIQQFQQLLNDNPFLQQQYDLIRQVFGDTGSSVLSDHNNYELQALSVLEKARKTAGQTHQEKIRQPVRKIKYWLVAASVTGLIVITVAFFYNTGAKKTEYKVAGIAKNGERKQ